VHAHGNDEDLSTQGYFATHTADGSRINRQSLVRNDLKISERLTISSIQRLFEKSF